MTLLDRARSKAGWQPARLQSFFLTRGILLIVLQFTVINLGWKLAEDGLVFTEISWSLLLHASAPTRFHGVLFSLTTSMILASILMRYSTPVVMAFAGLVLLAPELYLPLLTYPDVTRSVPSWIAALTIPGHWPDAFILYTPVPWLGMTLCGLILERLFLESRKRFEAMLIPVGLSALELFVLGIAIASLLDRPASLIEAFHLRRYPPHLLLLVYATGVNCLLLALLQRYNFGILDAVLITFGQSALMCYVTRLFIFLFAIRLSGQEPALTHGISLAVLCLAAMYPLSMAYSVLIKPRFRPALLRGERALRAATREILARD
ncbi:DUF1624 domain-containing protein [Thalassobius aquimarinus]|uniref:DUF1624 domain-containing protein n=2 Tax=Thalassovita aquimarina TaxID=2785917 RepID=A0ABS5HVD5_9RHOB|nr:DUF1624 domain-containing protein [Thalassovita aquimarina]